jgi:hypothetical protein
MYLKILFFGSLALLLSTLVLIAYFAISHTKSTFKLKGLRRVRRGGQSKSRYDPLLVVQIKSTSSSVITTQFTQSGLGVFNGIEHKNYSEAQ